MSVGAAKPRASHVWDRDESDFYMEPSWCSERLFETKAFRSGMWVLDPACGTGRVVEAAARAGMQAYGSDIVPRWLRMPESTPGLYQAADFLGADWFTGCSPDAIVSNPPFKHADLFVQLALKRSGSIVALLLPTTWMNGSKRSIWLKATPLYRVWILTPRPSMPPGDVLLQGGKPGSGKTDYAWFVWLHGYDGEPQLGWLNRDVSIKNGGVA